MAERRVKEGFNLNLRRKASLKAAVIAVIPSGAAVSVPDGNKGGKWTRAVYGDLEGYVMREYLSGGGGDE